MTSSAPAAPASAGGDHPQRSRLSVVLAVAALCLAAVAVYGSRGSLGLFIAPWETQFEASRGAVALVSTFGFLVYGAAQPLAGRLLERIPGRRIVLAGLALCAAGFTGAAVAESLFMVILLVGVVAAFGTGIASLPVLSVLATDLVHRREGLVFGLITAAAAGGQVVVLPLATASLDISVPAALVTIAVLLVIAAAAVFAIAPGHGRRAVARGPDRPTGYRHLFRGPQFWEILVPFFICGYTTTGLMDTHLIPYATGHHIPVTVASSVVATLAAFNVVGVLAAGALTDRYNRARLLAILYIVRAGTLLVLPLVTEPAGLFVFAAVYGVGTFATFPPVTALTRQVFHAGGWTVALGVISAAHQAGSALGAFLGGWMFDLTGGYTAAFVTAAVALLIGGAMSLRLGNRLREPAHT